MNTFWYACAALATTAACGGDSPFPLEEQETKLDGATWTGRTETRNPITVNVIEHDSIWSLQQAAARTKTLEPTEVRAFSYMEKDGTCVIHVINPDVDYQPEIIGHEFSHCAWGSFHPRGRGYRYE